MSQNAIEFINVSKKFRKGEKFDSLRDLVPNMAKRLLQKKSQNTELELKEKEFWAVKDVSFAIKKGEALGIIGPNGAGKSTILKLLSRILRPTTGSITINGKMGALLEVGAGFHQDLTGRENIYLSGAIMGMKKKEMDKKFDSIVAFSELEDFIDTPVKRYSSGMYVRLGFSVAAHLDPDILLIDEVLSVGDFRFQRKCMQKMDEFIKKNLTIIFISHNLPSVVDLCPTTILLNKGMVQEIGPTRKVVHDYYKAWSDTEKIEQNSLSLVASSLVNSKNESCMTFNAGENGTLVMEFISDKNINNIAVAFSVKREDGLVLFDAHSDLTAKQVFEFKANEKKIIKIHFRTSIPEGLYYLGVYLQNADGKLYFYNDELLQFHVTSPKLSAESYTFMEAKWE